MATWDYKRNHVQNDQRGDIYAQIGSKATLISIGPPNYTPGAKPVVVGMVQQMSMQQQRQIMEVFEIGSRRRYFLDNPHRSVVNMSRILVMGPSLLKVIGSGLLQATHGSAQDALPFYQAGDLDSVADTHDKNFWVNIASTLFSNTVGVMLEFREWRGDGSDAYYGGMYLSNCKIQSHSIALQSQQWLVQEDVSMIFEDVVPLGAGSSSAKSNEETQEVARRVYKEAGEEMASAQQLSWIENDNNVVGAGRKGPTPGESGGGSGMTPPGGQTELMR